MMRQGLVATLWVAVALCAPGQPALGQEGTHSVTIQLKPYHPPPRGVSREAIKLAVEAETRNLPLLVNPFPLVHWSFTVQSSRDGNTYSGIMVGNNALPGTAPSSVPVQIVPVIVNTVALGTAVDPITGSVTVETGAGRDQTSFNPTTPDSSCLASPNNVPIRLFRQSPLFKKADFNFGGIDVGVTQYGDAVQRGSFWNAIDHTAYHVLLGPVTKLTAVTFNVPAPVNGTGGLALDLSTLVSGACGRMGLVDVGSIDAFVTGQLAGLASQGVNPATFPIFVFYNTAFPVGDPTNLVNCCAGGYHNALNVGTDVAPVLQTYTAFDFDTTGAFGLASSDVAIASHEVAEWMADPYGGNSTPAWGNTGQVQGCQNDLEVADPLTGSEAPRIAMPNQFTYHLQEIAFFSWFFGAVNGGPPTLGVNNWFSNNGTFLANAGPPCQ